MLANKKTLDTPVLLTEKSIAKNLQKVKENFPKTLYFSNSYILNKQKYNKNILIILGRKILILPALFRVRKGIKAC